VVVPVAGDSGVPKKRLIHDLSLPFTLKRSVQKTIETYPNDWIVVHETLQNSLDAIQQSGKAKGYVRIDIDVDGEEVTVEDNGEGFPFDLTLLGFGASNKDPEDHRLCGEIGVGIKTVIACTNNFEFWAKYIDEKAGTLRKWHCKINDGYRYMKELAEDIELNYDEPTNVSREEETGTRLVYSFPKEDKRVRSLIEQIYGNYVASQRIDDSLAAGIVDKFRLAIEHYFRTTGYAANVNNLLQVNQTVPIDITIGLRCREVAAVGELGQVFLKNPTLTVSFPNKCWDAVEIINRSRKPRPYPIGYPTQTPFPGEGGYIGDYSSSYIYVQEFSDFSEAQKMLNNPKMRVPPNISDYKPYFERYVTGIYLVAGSREVLRKYLIDYPRSRFIAASGIPSVHEILTPSDVGGLGFINNISLIINLKQKLTYGKQTIKNPWLLGKVNAFFRDAFRSTLIHTAECIAGKVPESILPPAVMPSVSVVSRPSLGVPFLSLRKVPVEEMEVIALFFELVGRGYLPEYETWSISSREEFDGKMVIHYPGVTLPEPRSDRDLSNIEFKLCTSDLVDDFDAGRKVIEGLSLIIVWKDDMDERYRQGHSHYEIIDVEYSSWVKEHGPSHVRKCLRDRRTGREIPILELKQVIEDLPKA